MPEHGNARGGHAAGAKGYVEAERIVAHDTAPPEVRLAQEFLAQLPGEHERSWLALFAEWAGERDLGAEQQRAVRYEVLRLRIIGATERSLREAR